MSNNKVEVVEEEISFRTMPFSFKSMFNNILGSFIRECPGLVAAFLTLIVLISLVNTWLLPTAQGKFIDKLKNATPATVPWITLSIFLVLYLIERSLQLGMMYINQHMMPRFIRMVRMKFFRSTIFEYQRQAQNLEESELLTNLAAVPWAINTTFHYTIYVLALQSIIALGCTAYFASVDWRLGVAGLVAGVLMVGIFLSGSRQCLPSSYRTHAADKELYRTVLDKSANLDVIMQERLEEFELSQIQEVEDRKIRIHIANFHCYFTPKIAMTYVTILLIAAILVILLFKWKRQHGTAKPVTVGKVVALISVATLLGRCYDRIRESIGPLNSALGTLFHEGYRLTSGLTEKQAVVPHTIMPWSGKDAIDISELTFAHKGAEGPLFNRLALRVPNGTTTCIVGPSGAGKTTLFRMLTGLHREYEGSIRIFGTEIRDIDDVHRLRAHFQLVPQNPKLFDNTVLYNITYGRPHVTEAQVDQLVEDLELPAIFRNLPNGLHTPVGAEGKFLSGGQRQATMLLRALFSVAPIILLDEPTSNLDTESKTILMKAIQRAGEGRTILIITHDESLGQYCHVTRMP